MEGIEISQGLVGARRDIALLGVKGYVDTMTCSTLLGKITEYLNRGNLHLIVDMAQVNYVSSAGWGVFVGEIKGIREKGGDLKIVQMTPEVYDVFEMLEFNRILNHYEALEEAINDFDISIALDITKSERGVHQQVKNGVSNGTSLPIEKTGVGRESASAGVGLNSQKRRVELHLLPLTEKIKHIIIADPRRGLRKIRKELRTPQYGVNKVGFFALYRLLRRLNLENSVKRFRFYRSR